MENVYRMAKGGGSIVKRNGWWYFRKMENGRIFSRSCKTRDYHEAKRVAAEFSLGSDLPTRARLAAISEFLQPDEVNPGMDEVFALYEKHPRNIGQTQHARDMDYGTWKYFLRWVYGLHLKGGRRNCNGAHPSVKKLKDISTDYVAEFIRSAAAECAPRTVNRHMRVLKRIWKMVGMRKNPWDDFNKLPDEGMQKRAFTKEEVEWMIAKADGEMRVLFTIGPYTGLRMGDCAHLRWEDFDDNLTVLRTKPHKTMHTSGKVVIIPVHPKLREELERIGKKKEGYVMPQLAALSKWNLSDVVQHHFKVCGMEEKVKIEGYRNVVDKVGFHSFRSTFISALADVGAPLALVRDMVGHVSEEMTQRYYRSNLSTVAQYVNKL